MNRQHEDMVCTAATNHLRKDNWWGDDNQIEVEIDDGDTSDRESDDTMDGGNDGFKPHKAAFYGEYCADWKRWRIVHDGKPFHTPVYPVVRGQYGDKWVRALIDSASQDPIMKRFAVTQTFIPIRGSDVRGMTG